MSRRSVRHGLEYLGFLAADLVLGVVPERWALGLGGALGVLAGTVLRIRRGTVDRNLETAFPDRAPSWRARVARDSYRHLGREAVATFRLAHLSDEDVRARVRVRGVEKLREALESGRGAVVVTGHLGNWELGGAGVACLGIPIEGVAARQANPRFDRRLVAARRRLGMGVLRKGEAVREGIRALREGRVVALVGDQNARRAGIFVDFFGKPASTARGPALLALRAGTPLVLGICTATEGGAARYEVVLEPVAEPREGDLTGRVRALTEAHTAGLERHVRRAPEQYMWQHKRWKTRPPEETGSQRERVGTEEPVSRGTV